ncbi:MAG TPA: hypothetical protein VFF65_04950, partial [Phycisphaerales bacterium]|nr:hypothetical protein [Phycisphaerales bacterium]
MAKHPTIETDAPLPMIIEMRCRKCRAPLTVALRLLNPVPPRVVKDGEQLLDRGEAALSHTVRTRG